MSRTTELAGGYLTTDIQLACKTDRMAAWEPKDPVCDARNSDPRTVVIKAATAEKAEAEVRAVLARRRA